MRGVRVLVAVVLLAAGLVGCSAEPEVAPEPSSSSSEPSAPITSEAPVEPSPTTQVLAAPVLPAAATTPDAAGAEAFVRYWYELVNYAYASGDVDVIPPISHVDCVACVETVANIETATDVGAAWVDLSFVPEQFEVAAPDGDGISLVTALVLTSPDPKVRQADGTVVDATGPEAEIVRFWAQWTGDHWQTFEVSFPDRDR